MYIVKNTDQEVALRTENAKYVSEFRRKKEVKRTVDNYTVFNRNNGKTVCLANFKGD